MQIAMVLAAAPKSDCDSQAAGASRMRQSHKQQTYKGRCTVVSIQTQATGPLLNAQEFTASCMLDGVLEVIDDVLLAVLAGLQVVHDDLQVLLDLKPHQRGPCRHNLQNDNVMCLYPRAIQHSQQLVHTKAADTYVI
jgi:hypothetical protein